MSTEQKKYRGLLLEKEENPQVFSVSFKENGDFDIDYDNRNWNELTNEEVEGILSTLQDCHRSIIEYVAMATMLEENTHDA